MGGARRVRIGRDTRRRGERCGRPLRISPAARVHDTYARSRYLLEEFKRCFEAFDRLFILETYAAREAIADGMTAKQLSEEITSPPPTYCETFEGAAEAVAADLRPGDVFFTVGAGDVDSVGPMVLEHLRKKAGS